MHTNKHHQQVVASRCNLLQHAALLHHAVLCCNIAGVAAYYIFAMYGICVCLEIAADVDAGSARNEPCKRTRMQSARRAPVDHPQ